MILPFFLWWVLFFPWWGPQVLTKLKEGKLPLGGATTWPVDRLEHSLAALAATAVPKARPAVVAITAIATAVHPFPPLPPAQFSSAIQDAPALSSAHLDDPEADIDEEEP